MSSKDLIDSIAVEMKKKPEDLMLTNDDPLVSSEPPPLISTPKSSIDQPLPLDKSSDTAAQYFKDQISDPMEVDDSESEDDAEESDVQFTPIQPRASYRQNYKRKAKAKKTEASKVSFQHDSWSMNHGLWYFYHNFENLCKSLMESVLAKKDNWKCGICSRLFASFGVLRQHILTNHKLEDGKELKICNRCPYTHEASYTVRMHEKSHFKNDANF